MIYAEISTDHKAKRLFVYVIGDYHALSSASRSCHSFGFPSGASKTQNRRWKISVDAGSVGQTTEVHGCAVRVQPWFQALVARSRIEPLHIGFWQRKEVVSVDVFRAKVLLKLGHAARTRCSCKYGPEKSQASRSYSNPEILRFMNPSSSHCSIPNCGSPSIVEIDMLRHNLSKPYPCSNRETHEGARSQTYFQNDMFTLHPRSWLRL